MLRCTTLLLSRLIQGRALRYAVIVAFPDNVGIGGESEQSLNSFTVQSSISTIPLMTLYLSQCSLGVFHLPRKLAGDSWGISLHQYKAGRAHRILIFLPPSILVQTLKTSSPLLTLSTAPQTSSLASAN